MVLWLVQEEEEEESEVHNIYINPEPGHNIAAYHSPDVGACDSLSGFSLYRPHPRGVGGAGEVASGDAQITK